MYECGDKKIQAFFSMSFPDIKILNFLLLQNATGIKTNKILSFDPVFSQKEFLLFASNLFLNKKPFYTQKTKGVLLFLHENRQLIHRT